MELSQQLKQQFITCSNKLLLSFACCDLCGKPCQHYALLCQACFNDLPRFNLTSVQADLLNWPAINQALPDIHFDHLLCLSPYLPPFSRWLTQFKYLGRFELAPFFGHLLADHLKQHWLSSAIHYLPPQPDLILSVPLHIKKWQTRGYNQAHLVAKNFAKQVQLPYNSSGLIRHKPTMSQVGQSGAQRRKSLKDAFEVNLPTEINSTTRAKKKMRNNTDKTPLHVLLIDDVVTTGATTSEIAKILKQIGVKKVTVVALCLSLPNVAPSLAR